MTQHTDQQYGYLYRIVQEIGNNINRNKSVQKIGNNVKKNEYDSKVAELGKFLNENKEIVIDEKIFQAAMGNPRSDKISKEAIYYLLSHCIENNNNTKSKEGSTLSFRDVIDCLKEAKETKQYFGNLSDLLSYQNSEDGKTLLHKAVEANNIEAISSLLSLDVDSLPTDKKGKTPLMLAKKEDTREALTKGMKNQASQLRNSARMYAMIGFTMFFIPVIGVSAAVCAISTAVPCSIALGAGATIALIVSSGVGLAVYSFSQDRNKAEGINDAIAATNLKVDNAEKRDSKEGNPILLC